VTRVNIGVPPAELCDQHLLAEWHEIGRLRTLHDRRAARMPADKAAPHVHPCLNTGHMISLLAWGVDIRQRIIDLADELRYRGVAVSATPRAPLTMGILPSSWMHCFAAQVRQRIADRLATMRRTPTWTNRTAPEYWSHK
jgi:hypothetical protein